MCACALPHPAQGGRGGGGCGDAHAALAEDQQEDLAVAEIFAANQRMRYMPLIQSAIARDRAKCVCVSVRCVCVCVCVLCRQRRRSRSQILKSLCPRAFTS